MSLRFSGIVKETSVSNAAACFLMGNYLFVFDYYFSFKYPNTAKKKEPQVKLEVLSKKERLRDYFHTLNQIIFYYFTTVFQPAL